MHFSEYIFAVILLNTISAISGNIVCQKKNEVKSNAEDRCEYHCGFKSFSESQKNKPNCICRSGFARSKAEICIPIHNCVSECGNNEIFKITPGTRCDFTCKCKQDHYRNNGTCSLCEYPSIYMERCQEFDNNECVCNKCKNTDNCKLCKGNCRQNHLNCKSYSTKYCECTACDRGFKLKKGKCYEEKCKNTCERGEIKDQETCECKLCPKGLIACNDQCINYPVFCSTFQIDECKCVQCEKGYVFNDDGNCVPDVCVCFEDCPANEEYQSCGTACPPTCDKPVPTACTRQCVSGCFCKKGFFRDLNDNQCVEMKNCTCSFKNTKFCLCGPEEPATCKNPFANNDNECNPDLPGCYCIEGTIRDTQTGQCVEPEHCTCKKDHEVYDTCKAEPEATCLDPDPPVHTTECESGCFCDNGYVRNETGDCVLLDECACPPNEVNSDEGCICRPGYERNPNNDYECMEENPCPSPNEEYNECGAPCPSTCANMTIHECDQFCTPGCFCIEGTVRDEETGLCIPREECCKFNQIYFKCYPDSDGKCEEGCFCPKGTVKHPTNGRCVRPNSSESSNGNSRERNKSSKNSEEDSK